MFTKIFIIECLSDNYAYIVHNIKNGYNILIDAPEEKKILDFLEKKRWNLNSILLTHHHHDHIAGVDSLRKKFKAKVYGAKKDIYRLPKLDFELEEQDFFVDKLKFKSIDVSGHTNGHLAYYLESENSLFSGDSLMTFGCGKLFEGTAYQMFDSLEKIKKLPKETKIFSGHEYSLNNARFAFSIESRNDKIINRMEKIENQLKEKLPTVPITLREELETNPFLRTHIFEIKEKLGLKNMPEKDIFKKIRELKDNF